VREACRSGRFDAGWRVARAEDANAREFRAGFTWAIPLGGCGAAGTGPSILRPQGRRPIEALRFE